MNDPLKTKQRLMEEYQKRKPDKVKTAKEMGLTFEPSTFDHFREIEDYLDVDDVCFDSDYVPLSKRTFKISPFDITEIQYLRGLIMNDQLVNDYENVGDKALISRNRTMYEFTNELLKLLDEFEEGRLNK